MSHNFSIEKITLSSLTYIVFTMNYVRFSDYWDEVAKVMADRRFTGTIFIDLLLNNGRENRFFEVTFRDGHFDYSTFKEIESPATELLKASSNFYLKRLDLIDNSTFSKAKKFMIRKDLEKYADDSVSKG